ncbi:MULTISPECIES: hypothetical protein [Citrobacter]|uniref:hypothetical protein n=1 Tax=Citrobacter TaxID=544 RepID=UPI001904E9FD|nr:hypothetical protein [Citrobacter amalonaticus]
MLDRNNLEETIKEMAPQQGHELNGQDQLIIGTRINSALYKRATPPEDVGITVSME